MHVVGEYWEFWHDCVKASHFLKNSAGCLEPPGVLFDPDILEERAVELSHQRNVSMVVASLKAVKKVDFGRVDYGVARAIVIQVKLSSFSTIDVVISRVYEEGVILRVRNLHSWVACKLDELLHIPNIYDFISTHNNLDLFLLMNTSICSIYCNLKHVGILIRSRDVTG